MKNLLLLALFIISISSCEKEKLYTCNTFLVVNTVSMTDVVIQDNWTYHLDKEEADYTCLLIDLKAFEEGLGKPTWDFEPHCNCHLE